MEPPKTGNLAASKARLQKPAGRRSTAVLNASAASHARLEPASPSVRSRNALSSISSGVYGRGSQQRIRASQSTLDRNGKPVQEKAVQVLDEEGNDVTPLSLLAPQQVGHVRKGHGGASATELSSMASVARETVADVLNNLESMTVGSWNQSVFGRSAMMGMSFLSSSRMSGAESGDEDEASSVGSAESAEDREELLKEDRVSVAAAATSRTLGEAELNKLVHINLTETETIPLLDITAVTVSNESGDEATAVRAANAKYKEVLESRAANENFVDRGMQTFNDPLKTKEIQAPGPKGVNVECMVTQWSIYDAYHLEGTEKTSEGISKDGDNEALSNLGEQSAPASIGLQGSVGDSSMLQGNKLASSSMVMSDAAGAMSRSVFLPEGETMSDLYASVGPGAKRNSLSIGPGMHRGGDMVDVASDIVAGPEVTLAGLNQKNLQNSLLVLERAVVANNFEKKLLQYRNVMDAEEAKQREIAARQEALDQTPEGLPGASPGGPAAGDKARDDKRDVDSIPTVDFLWSYRCELTRGRAVSFLVWNKENEDILAVAYGEQKPGPNPHAGLVLCWSVKNPEWPERIYRSKSPVTAIDFSRSTPNLLACGYVDGRIAIYDVRRKEDEPVMDNSDLAGKHRDPIWELRWVERERGDEHARGETLVSVSTDGRVTQWLIRKGLEYTDLMSLKRVTKQQEIKAGAAAGTAAGSAGSGNKPGSFIARQSGGLCFDFNPKDNNIYMVGTDDGHIHRCSCSYNEQYLATYFGHTGPVNRIRWSPFLSGAFLSCSCDWTVRLWNQDMEEPVFKFQSGKDTITDVAWSPASSTVFGCVSTDGRMEIWDLQLSVLDPAILHTVLDRRLTSIIFASKSPAVLTGDDNGAVNVYKLRKLVSSSASPSTPMPDGAFGPGYGVMDQTAMELQAQILINVMQSKNQTGAAPAGSGPGVTASSSTGGSGAQAGAALPTAGTQATGVTA
ncbi:uncharacterized protein SPPG_02986 [Spizellomyces punctatus DAOM BR117]|uniref:Dynein axonemal intermediate chain 4 n=1 Tax=Spizellomyces punctatus (strain DAOM BR117) TaxID=645134 RepID=A0A0L0HN62_SPIPD|nr:uncharacterized protein SPPG_02986 [Spizellomyces punctatus DAOM BR117]KND02527.1 hypothetical protein SPPG_02986 [Spizellomyces punctatus DAOM BR117]|eukprot:XP_016610566.1 hypothetical protein SPPG_02986 [Spizellomyces punctatus DAOM BR117]